MRIGKAGINLTGIELVHDERGAVTLRHGSDTFDLLRRIDASDGIVRVGENEQLRAVLERFLQFFQIDARAASGFFVRHVDGHHFAVEELHHLAVREIVGLYERDLITGHYVAAHGEEQGALRAGRQDEFALRIDGHSGKRRDALRDHFQDRWLAFIRRVRLGSAFLHACREYFETAGGRGVGIHVAMAEVNGGAFQFLASEIQRDFFLLAFLTGCIVDAQMVEFFCDGVIHENASLFCGAADLLLFDVYLACLRRPGRVRAARLQLFHFADQVLGDFDPRGFLGVDDLTDHELSGHVQQHTGVVLCQTQLFRQEVEHLPRSLDGRLVKRVAVRDGDPLAVVFDHGKGQACLRDDVDGERCPAFDLQTAVADLAVAHDRVEVSGGK